MLHETKTITQGVTYKTCEENDEGQRLDNFLSRNLKGVPRSMIYRILRRGEVRVNKGRVSPSYKLKSGDVVRIPPVTVTEGPVTIPSSNLHLVQNLKERIVYEDEGILVVNKPAGLAAHGGSGIEFGLIEALRALRSELKFLELAHRLDRETSGCLIVAKRRSALRDLHEQFRQRVVKKRYLTLVKGQWERSLHLVSAPLVRNELKSGERMVQVNAQEGAPASTGYEIVEKFAQATLMAALPHTGRTHQIRVHSAYSGHPVLGDDKYGDKEFNEQMRSEAGLNRMFLHAFRINFLNPTDGKLLKLEAPLPPELESVLEVLRGRS